MVLRKKIALQIIDLLKKNPEGMSIKDIVNVIDINRNTAGRYLENLLVSGQVEMRRLGMAKIYAFSQRVPLSAVLSISSELVMQLDSSLRIIFANEPFLKLIETDSKNLLGKNIEYTSVATVFDDVFPGFLETIREGLTGKEWAGDILLTTKDLSFISRIAPTVFEDGRKGVTVILEDITQQKLAEKALLESESKLRSIADNSPDMILLINLKWEILFINRTITLDPSQVRGKLVFDFIPQEFHDTAIKCFENVLKTGEVTIYGTEYHIPNGKTSYFESTVGPVFQNGTIGALVINARDITERKRAEKELQESEARYRTIFENTGTATIQIEENTQISLVNAEFEHLSGFSRHEIEGKKSWTEFVVKEDLERMLNQHRLRREGRERSLKNYEFQFITKSGDIRNIFLTVDMIPGTKKSIASLVDLTERKDAEKLRQESEERYRQLVDISPDGIFIHQQGKIIFLNPAALNMLGASHSDMITGKNVIDLIHPDFREAVRKNIEKDLQGNTTPPLELHMLRVDGSSIMVEGRGIKTTINGKPAIQVAIRDITERKRAEIALQKSEEQYRSLVETTGTGYVIIDKAGRVITANQEYVRLTGRLTLAEIERRPVTDWTASYDIERNAREIEQCFSNGQVRGFEVDYQRPDGTIQPIEVNASIIQSKSGQIFLTLCRDITERKRAEVALRESEGKLNAMLQSISDHMSMMDKDLNIIWANETAKLSFGKDIVGKKCYEIYHRRQEPCEPYPCITLKAFLDGKTHQHETTVIDNQGEERFFECTANVALRDNSGKPVAVLEISRDITERKRAEIALRESEQRFQRLLELSFDAIVIHKNKKVAFVNERAAKILGAASSQDLIGRSILDFVHPDSRRVVEERVRIMSTGSGTPVPVISEKFVRVDGTMITVEVMAISFDDNGSPAVQVAFREIASQEGL